MKAYLDIETSFAGDITVVGIFQPPGKVIQLVGDEINRGSVLKSLKGVRTIYTYNGSRFDLPKIKNRLGLDLRERFDCHDLMYDCWANNLFGGLKVVEQTLGIKRETKDVDGWMAMELWEEYESRDSEDALKLLLDYNKDDIVNLEVLRKKLGVR